MERYHDWLFWPVRREENKGAVIICLFTFFFFFSCRIATFRKRFGAHSISLVYQVTPETPFHPQGYIYPGKTYEAPQGIHSFPFIFCHPKASSMIHTREYQTTNIIYYRVHLLSIYLVSFPSFKEVEQDWMTQRQVLFIFLTMWLEAPIILCELIVMLCLSLFILTNTSIENQLRLNLLPILLPL